MKRLFPLLSVSIISCIIGVVSASSGNQSTGNVTTGFVPTANVIFTSPTMTVEPSVKKKITVKPRPLTLGKFFIDTCSRLGEGMPTIYTEIAIHRPNVEKGSKLYTSLQKCAYLGLIETKGKVTNFQVPIKGNFIYDFFGQKLHIDVKTELVGDEPVSTKVREQDIRYTVPTFYAIERLLNISGFGSNGAYESNVINSTYFTTFAQVFNQIQQNYHYLSGDTSDENLLYGAIKGLVDSLHDKYSVYFPPEQSADFYSSIQGTFYGVGMYLDIRDGKPVISSTISGAPASQAGLQAGDIITAVDTRDVPDTFTLNEVVAKIKGLADTQVTIHVMRGLEQLQFTVKRKKIVIPMIHTEKKNRSFIFTLNSFGQGLTYLFGSGVETYKNDIAQANNIIIDVRNNPGGYVEEAAGVLGFFVPKNEPVIVMQQKSTKEILYSQGFADPFSGKQLYILVNKGSASASEILAGTIKDYFPTAKIIGEQSFGKGSAQGVFGLPNGGSVKYTIALWKTGKSETSIEGVGITPDVILKDDPKTVEDELLDKVLSW